MIHGPRITLISALAQSPAPALAAMAEVWPRAQASNLIDDSLAGDLARLGSITAEIEERFLTLGRYAASASDGKHKTRGILFTCSAFRPAINRVKADLAIPVVTPNEAAFEAALELASKRKGRIGLLLSFAGSLDPLQSELAEVAAETGLPLADIACQVADGALEALEAADPAEHDRLIGEAAKRLPEVDAIVIGQFSMARAAGAVRRLRSEPVLTTPHMAVEKLRRLVEG